MYIIGTTGADVNEYTLSTGFNISTASYSQNFSVSGQEASPRGMAFNNDGTKMYIVGSSNDTVYEYDLTTGFNVSTASYSSRSFSVASEATFPADIAFNTNGTKMFIAGGDNDTIYAYSLSTGFDVSTASYSESLSVSSQISILRGIAFNSDGTKLFAGDASGVDVNEYTLEQTIAIPSGYNAVHTTASTDSQYWTDINSMTADEAAGDGAIYYAVSTDDRTTWKIAKSTDGERSIVRNNSGTWQYNSNGTYGSTTWTNGTTNTELATLQEAMTGASTTAGQFDVSNASYSQSFSVSAQENSPSGITFNTDGTKMFVVGTTGDDVNEYSLSTGFDVSTASYSQNFSVASQDTAPSGIRFNTDGTKMFVLGYQTDRVHEYTLSTGFDVSTASFSQNFYVGGQEITPLGLAFNTDGTKMFIIGSGGQDVNEYTLSTGFDVSTATYSQNFSIVAQDISPQDLAFNSDGTKMYFVGVNNDAVYEYTLSTAFDISTASYSQNFSVASEDTVPTGLAFNADGSKMFVCGGTGDAVYEYNVSATAYTNQMNKTQLDAVSDANHFTLGNDLDLAIIFNMSSGTTVPSSDGVAINFDANSLNQGAILGTDYNWDFPAADKVRITSLAAQNLKVRII
jgi:DNA-binding beta-propeller fold protein YncE